MRDIAGTSRTLNAPSNELWNWLANEQKHSDAEVIRSTRYWMNMNPE